MLVMLYSFDFISKKELFLFKTVLEKNRKIKTSGITKAVFQNLEFCPIFVPSSKKKKNLMLR